MELASRSHLDARVLPTAFFVELIPSWGIAALFLGRILTGIGSGMSVPSSAFFATQTPTSERSTYVGYNQSLGRLVTPLAPALCLLFIALPAFSPPFFANQCGSDPLEPEKHCMFSQFSYVGWVSPRPVRFAFLAGAEALRTDNAKRSTVHLLHERLQPAAAAPPFHRAAAARRWGNPRPQAAAAIDQMGVPASSEDAGVGVVRAVDAEQLYVCSSSLLWQNSLTEFVAQTTPR